MAFFMINLNLIAMPWREFRLLSGASKAYMINNACFPPNALKITEPAPYREMRCLWRKSKPEWK